MFFMIPALLEGLISGFLKMGTKNSILTSSSTFQIAQQQMI